MQTTARGRPGRISRHHASALGPCFCWHAIQHTWSACDPLHVTSTVVSPSKHSPPSTLIKMSHSYLEQGIVEIGTFPVTIRQPQSTPFAIKAFNESQQSWVGEEPVLLLPVT
ncbi:DNA mismatch repair protein MutL [Striga asiatica]|uniref:DNA mismatch repair protein MutL n=1 Tax=Striga asiatica TaxID=4170 RepID=A0A5A7NX07_STRAF|nr:DNA mismatch repair protein MutL [Striga asiatica]